MQLLSCLHERGFNITKGSRSYTPSWDDPDLDGRFVRAQEMSRYVEDGFFDCGLTGRDWVKENESDVELWLILFIAGSQTEFQNGY